MGVQNEPLDENDDDQNFKEMLQAEYEGSSNFTSVFNGNSNSETVQSLSSFNPSTNSKPPLFNIWFEASKLSYLFEESRNLKSN